jgi:hypothetical protein
MSLEESFQGVAAFDEFPTNVARRKSVRIRAQHAYWLENANDRQSLVAGS